MLANKPLSPYILPMSALVSSNMKEDDALSLELVAPFAKHTLGQQRKSPTGRDSVSSNVSDPFPEECPFLLPSATLPYEESQALKAPEEPTEEPVENIILKKPLTNFQEILLEDQPVKAKAGARGEIELDIKIIELMESVHESYPPDSPYSMDLEDELEMDLDQVAHVADYSQAPIDSIERCLGSKAECEGEISNRITSYLKRLAWLDSYSHSNAGPITKSSKSDAAPSDSSKRISAKPKRDPEIPERSRAGSIKPTSRDSIPPNYKSSRSSISEPRSEPKPKQPKPASSSTKKPKDKEEYKSSKSTKKRTKLDKDDNDFDKVLKSVEKSQNDSEPKPFRRTSEPRDSRSSAEPFSSKSAGTETTSSSSLTKRDSTSSHNNYNSRRPSEKENRYYDRSSVGRDTRKPVRSDRRPDTNRSRSPSRSSQQPSGSRSFTSRSQPPE